MIVNGCYMSVGLFCNVFNDIYSKILIFGAIITKMNINEHFGIHIIKFTSDT